jgi:hypothetical protein
MLQAPSTSPIMNTKPCVDLQVPIRKLGNEETIGLRLACSNLDARFDSDVHGMHVVLPRALEKYPSPWIKPQAPLRRLAVKTT